MILLRIKRDCERGLPGVCLESIAVWKFTKIYVKAVLLKPACTFKPLRLLFEKMQIQVEWNWVDLKFSISGKFPGGADTTRPKTTL